MSYYNSDAGTVLNAASMLGLYGTQLSEEQLKELGYLLFTPLECEAGPAFTKRIVFTGSAYEEVLVATPEAVEAVATADAAMERVKALEARLVAAKLIEAAPAPGSPTEPDWKAMTETEIVDYCQENFGETPDVNQPKEALNARAHEIWVLAYG
jgi:hypothetical protein